jgi:hypothetical protein
VENVCDAHFEAQPAMTAVNQNSHDVSRMYPWQRKRLIMTNSYNLIREWKQPGRGSAFFCRRQVTEMFGKRRQNSTSTSTSLPYEKSDVAGVDNENDTNLLIRVPAPSNATQGRDNSSIPQSLNPSIPQSLNPSIPQFLNSSIPQFPNSPSFCLFWLPFLLPLVLPFLIAVSQSKITVQYNIANRMSKVSGG